MIRLFNLVWVLILLISGVSNAQAQRKVTKIPVTGGQFVVTVSPDGKTIATAELGILQRSVVSEEVLPLRLIDMESGKERAVLTGHTDYATDLAFSPDSGTLASYHAGGYIYLWDVGNARLIKTIPAVPGQARLAFLPDGQTLAVVQQNGIQLWDVESGAMVAYLTQRYASWEDLIEARGDGPPENFIDIVPTGSSILSLSWYGNINLWDIDSGDFTPIRVSTDDQPRLWITQLHVAGNLLIYADNEDHAIHIYDLTTYQELNVIPIGSSDVVADVSPDASQIAIAVGGDISMIDLVSQEITPLVSLDLPVELRAAPARTRLLFTPDGKRLVYGGFVRRDIQDNLIYIIDVG